MTLIEVLIAAAAFIIISFTLFEIVRHLAFSTQRLSTQQHQRADLSHFLDELESDQQSAEAVFIPATDVLGNADTPAHEIDFFTKDGANRPYYWAYYFDAAAHTITRYNYASPGAAPIHSGSTIATVQRFTPSLHQISEVTNPASPIYAPLFARATDYNVPVRSRLPGVQGGTQVIHLDLATNVESIPIDLAAAAAPSGFTVVLNYTPRPAPTFGLSLRTWPVAVAYGVNNTDVADASRMPQPFNVAMAINALLGGGIARASGCHAIAFLDTAMRTPDTTAGPGGCYDGHIHAYEATGTTATYQMPGNTCGFSVVAGAWSPSATGTQADLAMGSGSAIAGCTLTFDDGSGTPRSAAHGLVAAAVFACSPVVIAPTGGAYCLWYGSVASGYIYQGGTYNTGRVWMYDDATNPGPNLDCSDYANSGSCAWNANGAVSYCFQGTSPPSAPDDIANAAGFTCVDRGNPPSKPWPTIPCKATPSILCKGSGSGGPPRS